MAAHRQRPWRVDPEVLGRLPEVERRVLDGMHNTAIAAELGVSEATIRNDRKRLQELWLEQAGGEVRIRRLVRISQLEALHERAVRAATFDEQMERAVLFDEAAGWVECPGGVDHSPMGDLEPLDPGANDALKCKAPHRMPLRVKRDFKGSATFRGNKSAALNVARQALMDAAKIEGLVVDKVSPTDDQGRTLDLAALMALAKQGGGDDPNG